VISRYWQHMLPDDLVFFWLGGPRAIRGIYGWSTLTTTPVSDGDKQSRVTSSLLDLERHVASVVPTGARVESERL
jgi:hypothetical protein